MKKGFTLIELLSVIVVLAIISVIAIPTLIGVVNKVRLNSLKSSAYGLIEAGTLYNAQYANSNNVRFDIKNNIVTTAEENKIKYKGNVKQGTVIVSTKGQVSVCVTDGKNSAYKNYNDTEVIAVSKKTCTIPSSTYIVYLDDERTIKEYTNAELTVIVDDIENKILNKTYPVGSIYMTMDNTNPSSTIGGTWEKIEGRFLLGSSDNYEVGTTGGNSSVSYTPQGTVGNHTLTVNEMPSHAHGITTYNQSESTGWQIGEVMTGVTERLKRVWQTNTSGGSQPHNHPFTGTQTSIETMPPYVVVNVWKRTA